MNHMYNDDRPPSGQLMHHDIRPNGHAHSANSPSLGQRQRQTNGLTRDGSYGGYSDDTDVNNFHHQGFHQLYRNRREDSLDAHSQFSNSQHVDFPGSSYDEAFTPTPTSTSTSFSRASTREPPNRRTSISTSISRSSSSNRDPPTRQSTIEPEEGSKRSNYTDDALAQLCTSWLHVSQNPVIGSDQRRTKFWEKITTHYNQHMDKANQRTLKSLESRWATLNRNMSKFASCVQQIKSLKESGKSTEDQITDALALYKQDVKTSFKDMSSYNLVKHAPKWQENPAYLEHCGNGNSVGSDLDGLDLASDIDALPQMDRPTGTKKSKRGAGKSSLSEEYAPKMLENSSEVALSSRELANQGKEAQATLSKMLDYSLLSTNLSSIDECVRAEFEAERADIIRKQHARRAAERALE